MSEKRIMHLELTQQHHDRRITDHEGKLETLMAWREVIQESTEVNREMVEVGKNLLVAMRWVAIAAKWVATISAGVLACVAAIKWLAGKL